MNASTPQPAPKNDDTSPEVWTEIIRDIDRAMASEQDLLRRGVLRLLRKDCEERDAFGRQKYGVPLRAANGRDPMLDCYQELLDAAAYSFQAVIRREAAPKLFQDVFSMALSLRATIDHRDRLLRARDGVQ